jgi:hypothetical protein
VSALRPRLLGSRRAARVLEDRLGREVARSALAEARAAFPAAVADLPALGAARHMNSLPLLEAGYFVALCRALRPRLPDGEVGRLYCDMFQAFLDGVPAWLRRLQGWRKTGRAYVARYRRYCETTQLRRHPDDFVCHFVEGDGETFDWGYDYTRCAILELLRRQGLAALAPWFCHVDFQLARAYHRGLDRPTTLSEGDDACRFRYRAGAETVVRTPPAR